MFTLFRSLTLRQALLNQAPSLIASLAIAEFFYKFHSFLLQTMAFLATSFVIDMVVSLLFPAAADAGDGAAPDA